ncbi:MAG: hypothetical protein FWF05_01185 [Oscillospiraceae bacterium]|nr:hypothetical protein [Oscillospiraceae bacterium]
MENNELKREIILPEELQKRILKFFLKTSIPRKARQEKIEKALSETKGQDIC